MIFIYQILVFILLPVIKFNVLLRIYNNKEIADRHKERYGISDYKLNAQKKIIWIHAASVGEFKSADFFIQKYYKKYTLLITTTTVSSAKYAKKYYGNKIIHQFAPLDVSFWVKKFLKKWNPVFVIWIESDLWPTTLNILKKKRIKAILVNLRLSPNSYNKWKLIPFFYNNLLSGFTEIFAQSILDQERIKSITNKRINYIGNLKFTNHNNLEKNSRKYSQLLKDSKITKIMLASTHRNEDEKLIIIFKKLLIENKNLQLIVAPRHPERSNEIIKICKQNNLSYKLESSKNHKFEKVIIIDSFGILSDFYKISDIVFLGGSLVNKGGHNPIEAAINKCAIITGDHLFNWQNIYNNMEKKHACIRVYSAGEFEENLEKLLNDKKIIIKLKENSFNFSKEQLVETKYIEEIINKI